MKSKKCLNQVPSRASENIEKTFCITNRLLYSIIITMMSTVSTSRAPTTASIPPTTPPIVEPDTAVKLRPSNQSQWCDVSCVGPLPWVVGISTAVLNWPALKPRALSLSRALVSSRSANAWSALIGWLVAWLMMMKPTSILQWENTKSSDNVYATVTTRKIKSGKKRRRNRESWRTLRVVQLEILLLLRLVLCKSQPVDGRQFHDKTAPWHRYLEAQLLQDIPTLEYT